MFNCSEDGLILFFEINKMEIKKIKRKNQFIYGESHKFILKRLKYKYQENKKNEEALEKELNKFF